jgi:hypothetical protein
MFRVLRQLSYDIDWEYKNEVTLALNRYYNASDRKFSDPG